MQKNYQLVKNDWWQRFFALVFRVTFSNNADNACGTTYVEVDNIFYQALNFRKAIIFNLLHSKRPLVHDELL